MPRPPRIEYPGACYHVIARGNNRSTIFLDEDDFARFLEVLADGQRRYRYQVFAYALLANHLHLAVETGELGLSKCMQSLTTSYALYFNRRHNRSGHVFQGRYQAILCERDTYMLELVRHLHLLPVRERLAPEPGDYPWTSHQAYLGLAPDGAAQPKPILDDFFSADTEGAIEGYRRFIGEGLRDGVRWEPSLLPRVDGQGVGQEGVEPERPRVELEELLSVVSRVTGVRADQIRGRGQDRRSSTARSLFCYTATSMAASKRGSIARMLGRDPSAVTHACRRFEQRLASERGARKLVQKVEDRLGAGVAQLSLFSLDL